MSGSGAQLALLLLGSYRKMVDTVISELAERGYPDVRPVHEFALRAIASGADNAAELGRRMSVSKQAAAKMIAIFQQRGYVTSAAHPTDARRNRIEVTARGLDLMRQGEAIFDDVRSVWRENFGDDGLSALEAQLATIVANAPIRVDTPGWIASDS